MDKKKQLLIILFVLLTCVAVFAPIGYLIASTQKEKKLKKLQAEAAAVEQTSTALDKYREEYLNSVKASKAENLKKMEDAKREYEKLMAMQGAVVQQHTRQVEVGTQVVSSGSSSSSGSTSSGGKVAVTKTVAKTVSKPSSSKPASTPTATS